MTIKTNRKPILFTLFLILRISNQTLEQTATNPKLQNAYLAFQAWKNCITSDPNKCTSNWNGYDVCSYNGVYCAPAPDNPSLLTVAGIDLNHANIMGTLPDDIGLLLPDLALIHLNSNRFFGPIPSTFCHLQLLHELDLSNNLFCGHFPSVLLTLQSLKYLDIRFNHFDGSIPPSVFDLNLDALFLNDNNFTSYSPKSLRNSPVSVLVLANNNLDCCFPPEIATMGSTLLELIILNSGLRGCLPENIGKLSQLTVLDLSFNQLTGTLPESIRHMKKLEQIDVADNNLSGEVPSSVCNLPHLQNFTYSNNYFCTEAPKCMQLKVKDDKFNCIPNRPSQRSPMECKACNAFGCSINPSLPPPPPPSPVYRPK